jgi:uncharacterized protein YacL
LQWVTGGFGALVGLATGIAVQTAFRRFEQQFRKLPADILLSRAVGLILGLIIANLMLAPLFLLPIPLEFSFLKPLLAVVGSLIFAFSGVSLADTHGRTVIRLINPNLMESMLVAEGTLKSATTKVLDTSCIIDGRIEQLLLTDFIEGQILVPNFVLLELQQLADLANDQKRTRGRRGLDILNRLRQNYPNRIAIRNVAYDDLNGVDAKLLRLVQELNGTLMTHDYNLSKVASVQNLQVLNINDLAQALRPTYLPGDSLDLRLLKQGKEPQQGVGYLEDGTMVVVDDGSTYIGGSSIQVVVTSALQTSAGRMIFAKPRATTVTGSA